MDNANVAGISSLISNISIVIHAKNTSNGVLKRFGYRLQRYEKKIYGSHLKI